MRHGRAARCGGGRGGPWRVRARIERFAEPAVLLLLRDRQAHGYELLDQLGELLPGERVDMGNLYRVLRALEEDGLVSSKWDETSPGPAKRVYRLSGAGETVLANWVTALEAARQRIDVFLTRYGEEVRDASP
jgi:PadR family transcriptional regulator, regulatory protein PadR